MKVPMNPAPRSLSAARAGGLRPAQRGLTMILTLIFLGVMTMLLGLAMLAGLVHRAGPDSAQPGLQQGPLLMQPFPLAVALQLSWSAASPKAS